MPLMLIDGSGHVLPFLNAEIPEGLSVPSPPRNGPRPLVIPLEESRVSDDFFPEERFRFTVGTDDDKAFGCFVVEEGKRRGLAFSRDFSPGEYFRRRMGVGKDRDVSDSTLWNYGTYGFLLFRLDEYVYFLDFSRDVALRPHARDVVWETGSAKSASVGGVSIP